MAVSRTNTHVYHQKYAKLCEGGWKRCVWWWDERRIFLEKTQTNLGSHQANQVDPVIARLKWMYWKRERAGICEDVDRNDGGYRCIQLTEERGSSNFRVKWQQKIWQGNLGPMPPLYESFNAIRMGKLTEGNEKQRIRTCGYYISKVKPNCALHSRGLIKFLGVNTARPK